jgi:hypothetical protein
MFVRALSKLRPVTIKLVFMQQTESANLKPFFLYLLHYVAPTWLQQSPIILRDAEEMGIEMRGSDLAAPFSTQGIEANEMIGAELITVDQNLEMRRSTLQQRGDQRLMELM